MNYDTVKVLKIQFVSHLDTSLHDSDETNPQNMT